MPKDESGNLVVGEPEATATRAVIWLHGFGDSPEGWAMAWQPLQGATSWSWHHLCAPLLEQPCLGNKKLRGWGQFHTQECIHVGSADYIDEDKSGAYAASVAKVLAEVERLEQRMPSKHVLLGGFSQGAAIALQCALQHPRPLAGCVAVSGWLTTAARKLLSDGWKGSTSFLLCHGTADDMVGFDCGEAASQILSKATSAEFKKFPGLKHESCPALMDAVAGFMCKQLGHSLDESIDWERGMDSDSESCDTLVYFHKNGIARLSRQLGEGAAITQTAVDDVLNPEPESLADEDIMVPVLLSDLNVLTNASPVEAAKAIVALVASGADGPHEITVKERVK